MPPFDRVLEIQEGVRAVAIRNVPATLSVFDSHFPRFAVLPGAMLLQDMTALAKLTCPRGAWRLRSAHTIRFRHFVTPGAQLVITAQVMKTTSGLIEVTVTAQDDGNTVADARRLVLERS